MRFPTTLRLAVTLALVTAGCGATSGQAPPEERPPPRASEPAVAEERVADVDPDPDVTDPSHVADPPVPDPSEPPQPPSAGRDLSAAPGAAEHHGECCTSSRTCGSLTCAPSHYATCARMCLIRCRPGDRCPPLGGTAGGHPECPEDGFCPVTPPGA